MTDADLWSRWAIWMSVAAAVVLIAAALLIIILVTARRILADAVRALNAAEAIRRQTSAIWQLEQTNDVAAEIREIVRGIEAKGTALVQALEHRGAPAGTERKTS
jgi:uncharacterized membrane protein YhiD involved in acid resistance